MNGLAERKRSRSAEVCLDDGSDTEIDLRAILKAGTIPLKGKSGRGAPKKKTKIDKLSNSQPLSKARLSSIQGNKSQDKTKALSF